MVSADLTANNVTFTKIVSTSANVGYINLSNSTATSIVNGNMQVIGTLIAGTFSGNVNAAASIIPSTSNNLNLGSTPNYFWNTGYIINVQSNSVTSDNITSTANVSVGGSLSVNTSVITTNGYSFGAGAPASANIDLFVPSLYRSAEYLVQMSCANSGGNYYHITKLLMVQDGVTPYITEYGSVYNNTSLGNITAGINAGNFFLQLTPTTANVVVKYIRSSLTP
jgi:hypothetical protein